MKVSKLLHGAEGTYCRSFFFDIKITTMMCKCIKYAYNMFMNKINLLLTQANDNLKDCRATIEKAVQVAEQYVFPKLRIDWDIDLLVTNRLYDIIIHEDGVGGRARANDFIEFTMPI